MQKDSGNNYTENKTEQEGFLCSFADTIFFTGTRSSVQ